MDKTPEIAALLRQINVRHSHKALRSLAPITFSVKQIRGLWPETDTG